MQIKQFTGASVDEILKQIRAELGDDAVIIQTRRIVRGGIGGFFGREMIEVTAAEGVDDEQQGRELGLNRAAARSVLDVRDEDDDLPNPFARHLQHRMSAATEAETDPRMYEGPAAAPANVYARHAAPELEERPFAPGGPERTQAIIDAAREAMRQARAAVRSRGCRGRRGSAGAHGLEPADAAGVHPGPPPPPRGGMNVMPDADAPGVGLPVWERVGPSRTPTRSAADTSAAYAEAVAAQFETPVEFEPVLEAPVARVAPAPAARAEVIEPAPPARPRPAVRRAAAPPPAAGHGRRPRRPRGHSDGDGGGAPRHRRRAGAAGPAPGRRPPGDRLGRRAGPGSRQGARGRPR